MTQECLYIDGQLADIPAKGLGITLNFASNIIDGITQRTKNYTNTVKLPVTERNARIFGRSEMVTVLGTTPYVWHTARYVRGGIEIIAEGRCYLLKVSTDYEVTVIWGEDGISRIIDAGLQLSDLTGGTWTVQQYPENYIGTTAPDSGYIWHNSLSDGNQTKPASALGDAPYQPSVRVPAILSAIGSRYGITFDTSAIDGDIASLYCLVTGRKGTVGTFRGESIYTTWNLIQADPPAANMLALANGFSWPNVFRVNTEKVRCVEALGKWGAHLAGNVAFRTSTMTSDEMQAVSVWVCDSGGSLKTQIGRGCNYLDTTNQFIAAFDADVEVEKGALLCLRIVFGSDTRTVTSSGGNATVTIPYAPEEVPFSTTSKTRTAPLFPNLPDVKIVDFIATVNAMCGTYLYVEPAAVGSGWRVVFSRLYSDTVADWTARLRMASRSMQLSEVFFAPSGWARHNYLMWQNEETGGDIPVDNVALSEERTWYKSPFAIPAGDGGYTMPYYKQNDDGAWEMSTPKPYLFKAVRWNPFGTSSNKVFYIAGNSGMGFASIVARKYGLLAAWMEHPKVIVAVVALTDAEVGSLRSVGRIYLAQFGSYFAPITIQYQATGTAKCTLLKLS